MKLGAVVGRRVRLALVGVVFAQALAGRAVEPGVPGAPPAYRRQATWARTMLATRSAWRATTAPESERAADRFRLGEAVKADFPVPWDWALQDSGGRLAGWFDATPDAREERRLIQRVLDELGSSGAALRAEFDARFQDGTPADDPTWWELYVRACEQRRAVRLRNLESAAPRIVFTRRRTIRPSFFAYTEGQSDAQHERHFEPDAALCLLEPGPPAGDWSAPVEFPGSWGRVRTLLADPAGVIRDPAVSFDGERVAFAWKRSLDADDYHLYELTVSSGQVRPVTSGLGFADYEPAYLPDGDLIFSSTRCVQTVDCWWTEVSNLYTCDPQGRRLRRLGFDQVHAVYPQVRDDGRVIYTRWDYNDRSQIWPQALFQMNADGTGQAEYYKNNSWFPTTIGHARGLPGTDRVVAVFMGHHTAQAGKLGLLDPGQGRQENAGAQLIAPVRDARPERIDAYGQEGELFQYPFPLSDREFLVGYAPLGWNEAHRAKGGADFGLYWMDADGRRELLATHGTLACQQPVPLVARAVPHVRPSTVDYRQTNGTYYVQDVYAGASLAGVPRGTVKRLRVVALDFRAAGVGHNGSSGPGGGALISTPIAVGNGAWDVKVVLGDATVHADGSAFFTVPARTPLYFQALDERNHAVQTMRSWSTLQPGENQSCIGCHESRNTAPPAVAAGATLALQAGPQTLIPFHGPARGFSFPREIQPILDRHCVRCHHDRNAQPPPERLEQALIRERDPAWIVQTPLLGWPGTPRPAVARDLASGDARTNRAAFSLLGVTTPDPVAKRAWSDAYLNLTLARATGDSVIPGAFFGAFDGRIVNWTGSQSIPTLLPPYVAGASQSRLFPLLADGHYGVELAREELDRLACWIDLFVPYCGDYFEANTWNDEERAKYDRFLAKRRRMEAEEGAGIRDWLTTRSGAGE